MNKYDDSSKAEMDNMWNELEEAFTFVKDVEFIRSVVLYSLSDANHIKNLFLHVKTWGLSLGATEDLPFVMANAGVMSKGARNWLELFLRIMYGNPFTRSSLCSFLSKVGHALQLDTIPAGSTISGQESEAHSLFEILRAFLVHIAIYVQRHRSFVILL
ncbi:uncharacterized protein TNCV_2238981 [Trichonephila clavipes]|nr:uncharacterized protein TNCV_2238981 [Trichonephila clavipes]